MATNIVQVLSRTDTWTDAAITAKSMGLMKTNQNTTLKPQNTANSHTYRTLKNNFNLQYIGFDVHLDNKSEVYNLCYFF